MRPKKREIIAHQTHTSNTLSSVKIARSLGDLFMFRESEKSLKRTPGGFLFRITFVEPEKVIKLCSITFLCFSRAQERTKRRSRFYVKTIKNNQNHTIMEKNMSISLFVIINVSHLQVITLIFILVIRFKQ
jgi:hypothetical protein